MLVSVDRSEGRVRLALAGELDLAVFDYLEAALDSALEQGPPRIVVDLAALTFLDVSGLRCCCGPPTARGRRAARTPWPSGRSGPWR